MAEKSPHDTPAELLAKTKRRYAATIRGPGQSLFELVEDEAPARRRAAWRVWAWTLDAILRGVLPTMTLGARGPILPGADSTQYELSEDVSLDTRISYGGSTITWRQVISGDLRFVTSNKQTLDHFAHRYSLVML
jgi:hypothetical protein